MLLLKVWQPFIFFLGGPGRPGVLVSFNLFKGVSLAVAEDEEDGPFFCLECGCWAHPDGEAAWVEDHKCLGWTGYEQVKLPISWASTN